MTGFAKACQAIDIKSLKDTFEKNVKSRTVWSSILVKRVDTQD